MNKSVAENSKKNISNYQNESYTNSRNYTRGNKSVARVITSIIRHIAMESRYIANDVRVISGSMRAISNSVGTLACIASAIALNSNLLKNANNTSHLHISKSKSTRSFDEYKTFKISEIAE
jgi:hypothetical protein